MLVPQQHDGEPAFDVHEQLMALITGGEVRRTHEYRLQRGKYTPAWFALPRGRRSFAAVLLLAQVCTTENLRELLRRRWITVGQLETFLKRTRLSNMHQALIERAIRLEGERMASLTEREAGAAAYSSGMGMTGELTRIAAGEGAPQAPLQTVIRYRRGRPVRTPA